MSLVDQKPGRPTLLLRIKDVAETLGLPYSTVTRKLRYGEIPGRKMIGGTPVVSRAIFEDYLRKEGLLEPSR